MKASELINELSALIQEHGDQPVNIDGNDADYSIGAVMAYDRDGNEPSEDNPSVELYLHRGRAISRSTPTS